MFHDMLALDFGRPRLAPLLAVLLASLLAAPAHAKDDASSVIRKFKEKDPGFEKVFSDAFGYAIFPTVGKGAIGIGAARGKGEVFERGVLIALGEVERQLGR